jgi:DNA-binding transcriptional MerR regulator
MAKKIQALADWISAHDAARLLSLKHDRPISPKYIRLLAKRKNQPVRTQPSSNRLLYSREDLEQVTIKQQRVHLSQP